MCIEDGFGVYTITHTLNKRSEPVWGRGKAWQECYVQRLLTVDVAVLDANIDAFYGGEGEGGDNGGG